MTVAEYSQQMQIWRSMSKKERLLLVRECSHLLIYPLRKKKVAWGVLLAQSLSHVRHQEKS